MRRRLLNLLTVMSLLLCVAVAVLWVRSYGNEDQLMLDVPYATGLYRGVAWNGDGRAGLSLDHFSWTTPTPVGHVEWRRFERRTEPLNSWVLARRPNGDGVQVAGMDFYFRRIKSVPPEAEASTTYGGFLVPHAYLVALCLAFPTMKATAYLRRRRRRKRNFCGSCGYDLRATPDRCPECGTTSGAQ